MQPNKISPEYIAGLVDGEGCFDLQFRKDIKYNRPGTPTYYSWKTQFIINARKDDLPLLEQVKEILQCGTIHFQTWLDRQMARYSVQDIQNLHTNLVPFFTEHQLHGKKKKDFELWAEAIEIIYSNKNNRNIQKGTRGFQTTTWKKKDFQRLIDIHKEMQQYKAKRRQGVKWISEAEAITASLPE